MKMRRLEIDNIASLRGNHLIDFDEITQMSSLFAITGQTGAGKSTILNCISLALFGEFYKNALNIDDLVTLGESLGRIALDFELRGKLYRIVWSSKVRKKSGELLKKAQNSPRKIYLWNDQEFKILEKPISEVIKIDHEQFCKTTVLNQGEFSKYLSSNFKDRKSILENLYSNEFLAQLAPKLNQNIKELQAHVKHQQTAIDSIGLLEEEQLKALRDGVKSSGKLLPTLDQQIDLLEKTSKIFGDIKQQILRLESNKTQLEQKEKQSKSEIANINVLKATVLKEEDNFKKLQSEYEANLPKWERAKQLKLNINKINDKVQNIPNLIKTIEETIELQSKKKIEITQKVKNHQLLQNKIQKTVIAKNLNPLEIDKLKALFDDYNKIKHLQEKELLLQEANTKTHLSFINDQKSIEKDLAKLKEQTNISKEFNAFGIEQLEQMRAGLGQNRDKIITEVEQLKSCITQISKHRDQKEVIFTKEKDNQDLIQSYQQQLKLAQNALDDIAKLKEQNEMQSHLISILERQINQEECIICESNVEMERITSRLNGLKKLKPKDFDETLSQKNFIEISSKLKMAQENAQQFKKQLSDIFEQIDQVFSQINALEIRKYLDSELNQSTAQLEELKNFAGEKLEKVSTSIADINQAIIALNENKAIEQKLKASAQDLLVKIKKEEESIQRSKEQIKLHDETINHLFKDILAIVPEYTSNPQELFNKDIEAIKKIENIDRDNKLANKEIEHLSSNIKRSTKDIVTQKSQQSELIDEKKNLCAQIHDIVGDDDPEKLATEALQNKNLVESKLKKKITDRETFIRENTQTNARITSLLDNNEAITNQLTHYLSQLHEFESHQVDFESSIEAIFKKIMLIELIEPDKKEAYVEIHDRLSITLKEKKESYKLTRDEHTKLKTQLSAQEEKEQQKAKIIAQFEEIHTKLEAKLKLQKLISADKFRNHVLEQIEADLVYQANHELSHLCQGRYELELDKVNQRIGQEFFIIDKLRGGLKRKVSTLSGGETFMVSLAMALALAELTTTQVEIDSFFIDEGFGTLDANSLEEVIEVLHAMKARGKSIGIISHIKDLTNQIPININLSKNNSGNSQIQIIQN